LNIKINSLEFSGNLVRAPWLYRQWMLAGNPAYFFDRLVNDFGDFVHYRGLFSFYLVNHPVLVKQVLMETHKSFDKNSLIYNRFRNVFGDGLVVSEGQRWNRQRKLMQPLFSPVSVRQYLEQMVDSANQLTERWQSLCRKGFVFDIAQEMNHLTLEVAGRALFHDGFDDASEKISEWTSVINHYSAKPPMPISGKLWFPTRTNRRLKLAMKEFYSFLEEMIEQRGHQSTQRDLLTVLLSTAHEETGQPMTDSEVMEEVLGMIIGGHETSSAALTWTWYELHHNPDWQQRLYEELATVLSGRAPTLDDLPKLKITKMILDETMRLHPPFWFENRNVNTDIELGGVRIPTGSMVAFSRYSLHRHRGFWRDAERFDPERFDPAAPENTRSSYAYVPFGGGPRTVSEFTLPRWN
jgi:cytochrome P450